MNGVQSILFGGVIMDSLSEPIRHLTLAVAVATSLFSRCPAQEVASVDLTKISARMELRRPQAASSVTGGYGGTEETIDCPPRDSTRTERVLQTSVVSLD